MDVTFFGRVTFNQPSSDAFDANTLSSIKPLIKVLLYIKGQTVN